jgi:hypothetical protein
MMDEEIEMLSYTDDDPDIGLLADAYAATTAGLDSYFQQCERNREARRNEWAGKSMDQRKNSEDAFPWKGASDQEVHVVSERMDTHVALAMSALSRSHIKALAVKVDSLPRAATVSAFAKWMASTYIRDFRAQHEEVVNYGLEKGIMITYVGWERVERTFRQDMNLEEIRQAAPEIADMIEMGENDEEIIAMFIQRFPKLKPARAAKALRQLRATGMAEVLVSRSALMDSRPIVRACAPDGEVFFPPWCMDPARAPYVFWRQLYTVQELEGKVASEGWSREWVDEMIENYRGIGVSDLIFDQSATFSGIATTDSEANRDLILVVHAYQRLIDQDDGSEGIYCTAFNPHFTGANKDVQAFGKRELMNGYDSMPFVVTRMSRDSKRMYDLQALPERLRGAQWQVKVQRDARTDRTSLATLPELTGPAARPPTERGPGRYITVRRAGEYTYMAPPPFDPGSIEIEQATLRMADGIAGLDAQNPLTPVRQQFVINKSLEHAASVLRLAYTCFQRFGPDEVFFNVTGVPDPVTLLNIADDEFEFTVTFDSLSTDPETMKARAEQMGSLMAMDRMGRIDQSKFIEFLAFTIDPAFASHILLPAEENQQKLVKAITDDFAKLSGGVAVGPQPNGAQATMQMLQTWFQQGDVAQRYQSDESFAKRVDDYVGQAQFQVTQAQNAEIGKIGTAPTEFQGSNVGP